MRTKVTFLLILSFISLKAQWSVLSTDYSNQLSVLEGFQIYCFQDSLIHAALWSTQRISMESYPHLVSLNKDGSNVQSLNLYRNQVPTTPTGVVWSNASFYMVLYDTTAQTILPYDQLKSRQIEFRDAVNHQVLWNGSGIFVVPSFLEKNIYIFSEEYFWLIDYKNNQLLKLSTVNGDTVQNFSMDLLNHEFSVDSSYAIDNIQFKGPDWKSSDTVFASAYFYKVDSVTNVPDYQYRTALIDLNALNVVSGTASPIPRQYRLDTDRMLVISDTTIVDWSNNEFDRYIFGDDLISAQRDTLLVVRSSKFNSDTANAYYKHDYLYQSRGEYTLYAEYVEDNLPNHPVFQSLFSLKARLRLYKSDSLVYQITLSDTSLSGFYDTFITEAYLFADGNCLLSLQVGSNSNTGRLLMIDAHGDYILSKEIHTLEDEPSLKIYPSVVEDFFQIEHYSPYKELSIFSSDGRQVMHKVLPEGNCEFNLNQLPVGRYTLLFQGKGSATIRSILKK